MEKKVYFLFLFKSTLNSKKKKNSISSCTLSNYKQSLSLSLPLEVTWLVAVPQSLLFILLTTASISALPQLSSGRPGQVLTINTCTIPLTLGSFGYCKNLFWVRLPSRRQLRMFCPCCESLI